MFKLISVFLISACSFLVMADELSPLKIDNVTTVTTEEAHKLFETGTLFVDVRKNSDWEAGRISDAAHLELKSEFTEQSLLAEASKETAVVIYCNGPKCLRSSKASEKAVKWGFTKVYFYRDGFPSWKLAGLPIE